MFRRDSVILVLVLAMVVAISACGKKTEPPVTDPVVQNEPPPPMEEPVEEPMEEPVVETKPMPVLEDVFFDYDKFSLTSDARRTLENNAMQLKDAMDYDITIEGHCDERGTNAYNLALGEKRAKAAKDYLTSLGVSASRITTVSYGEERPFAFGHDESAWKQNRRGHFVVKEQ